MNLTKPPSNQATESRTTSRDSSQYVIIQPHITYSNYLSAISSFCPSFCFRLQSCTTVRTDKVSSFADRSSILLTGQLGTASWGRVSVHMSRTPGVDSCIFPSIRSTSFSSGQPWSPHLIDGHQPTSDGQMVHKNAQFLGQLTPNSVVQSARPRPCNL
jgi:hypothetical protein